MVTINRDTTVAYIKLLHKNKDYYEAYSLLKALLHGYMQRYKFKKCVKYFRTYGRVLVSTSNGDVILGNYVKMYDGVKFNVLGINDGPASVKIGDYVSIGERTEIRCVKEIVIGDHTLIAWDVEIMDTDFHEIDHKITYKPIYIGENVWVGCRSTILKGITIGEGSVVAAGSIVTKNVPPHCLVAGNPAKIIKTNIQWNV